ncbi:MAG: hypothetical protein ACI8XC_000544, partial [Gammaproteobacteria bacterium]
SFVVFEFFKIRQHVFKAPTPITEFSLTIVILGLSTNV